MKIELKKSSVAAVAVQAMILPVFEGKEPVGTVADAMDKKCGGQITAFRKTGDFEGKLYQTAAIYPSKGVAAERIILAGLGKRDELTLDKFRGVFAKAVQHARSLKLKSVAATLDQSLANFALSDAVEAAVEGVMLGLYQFTPFKTVERDSIRTLDRFILAEEDAEAFAVVSSAAKAAETVCEAVCFARDMVSMPGNEMTPTDLAGEARKIARRNKKVSCSVMDESQMRKLGMNALLGVAKGSDQPAKFITLEYMGGTKTAPVVVLVGKGLTFDSGGISLKPAEKMDEMKTDMSGGAAVLGAVRAAADLGLKVNVIGLVPSTENLPGGSAYKPGDILKSYSGKTIEVLNTDAEGRLILADALSYAGKWKPAAILDAATLTGACVVALGEQTIGMMGTDDSLKAMVRDAAEKTGERVWELPLWEEYHELIKSDVADYKNSAGRPAGTITAAAFLSKFVGDFPWVHLDIAGPAWGTKDRPYIPKGASGVGVRLFTQFLRQWAETKKRA